MKVVRRTPGNTGEGLGATARKPTVPRSPRGDPSPQSPPSLTALQLEPWASPQGRLVTHTRNRTRLASLVPWL